MQHEHVRGVRGDTVVKVLCYKLEGRWFDLRTDVTRPNGLPETIQMEDVSVAEQALQCREFPHSTGHHMTVVTTLSEGTGPYNGRPHDMVPRPRKWTGWYE